jgi:FkbM family methyltransferase
VSLSRTLRFILDHPLNAGSRARALGRFVGWQIRSRVFPGPAIVPFVNGSRLTIRSGRPGSTGNLYTRLHEFAEMGFVLHALRQDDLLVDVGANIGAYSILAASLPGTRCIAFEPASDTYQLLAENVRLNGYESRVTVHRMAIGSEDGEVSFTARLDTVNHVAAPTDAGVAQEPVVLRRLDTVLMAETPTVIKIDVEGYETRVIEGASQTLRSEKLLAIVLEMNGSGARYGLDETKLDGALLACGFEPLSYDPLERTLIPVPKLNLSGNRIYIRDAESLQARLKSAAPFTLPGGLRV